MNLTQEVREYAIHKGMDPNEALQTGLQEKAEEFKQRGKIY